jgi:hypothetical protein
MGVISKAKARLAARRKTDGFLSLKDEAEMVVTTNTDVKVSIRGKDGWVPEIKGGRNLLAIYANVKVSNLTAEQRKALHNGGARTWYGQKAAAEANGVDETGLNGPNPLPQFGNQRYLIAHCWPHTVDSDPWSFYIRLYAFDDNGNEVNFPVTLGTREIKIIKFSA